MAEIDDLLDRVAEYDEELGEELEMEHMQELCQVADEAGRAVGALFMRLSRSSRPPRSGRSESVPLNGFSSFLDSIPTCRHGGRGGGRLIPHRPNWRTVAGFRPLDR